MAPGLVASFTSFVGELRRLRYWEASDLIICLELIFGCRKMVSRGMGFTD